MPSLRDYLADFAICFMFVVASAMWLIAMCIAGALLVWVGIRFDLAKCISVAALTFAAAGLLFANYKLHMDDYNDSFDREITGAYFAGIILIALVNMMALISPSDVGATIGTWMFLGGVGFILGLAITLGIYSLVVNYLEDRKWKPYYTNLGKTA